jgi:hypothetical protein
MPVRGLARGRTAKAVRSRVPRASRRTVARPLFFVDLFIATPAIGGGIALVAGSRAPAFSTDTLTRTPFIRSFGVPGLIVKMIVGFTGPPQDGVPRRVRKTIGASCGGVNRAGLPRGQTTLAVAVAALPRSA